MPTQYTQEQSHPDEWLPWVVNHTLSGPQQEEVDAHLQECRRCRQEVTVLERIRHAVKTIPVHPPGEVGLERLFLQVKEDKRPKPLPQRRTMSRWRPALAIAASLLIALQSGLLMDAWFFSKPVVPLAGPQEPGIILQVSFAPTATEADIRESLNMVNGAFISGPGQLGVYRIRLTFSPTDQKEINAALDSLRQQHSIISHVAKE